MPKVSVLIPTYNYAAFIGEAIESVLAQTFTDFELLIVDNCSTDNTEDIVRDFLSDTRVTYCRNEKNLGLVGNWNRCLELASGEYIKLLCSDDLLHPSQLEKFVGVMEEHPRVVIVSSYSERLGTKTGLRTTPMTHYITGEEFWRNQLFNNIQNWLGEPTTIMFRKSGLVVGRFCPDLKMFIDLEYWFRLLTIGDCYVIPEVLSYMRIHGEAQTAKIKKIKNEFAFEGFELIKCIKQAGADMPLAFKVQIDWLYRKRAASCASLVYKKILFIYKKDHRLQFRRAFEVAKTNKLFLSPFRQLLSRNKTGRAK